MDCPYSRILIGKNDLDNVLGFVKAKDLLNLLLRDEPLEIESVIKKPVYIPETTTALEVLEMFRDAKTHLAVIIDEFGSTHGLVTTNDILEAIVGDLQTDGICNEKAVKREDGSWLFDARISNAEFCEILDIKNVPEDEDGLYETLAGFIMKRLEKLLSTGDKFEWENYIFEVVNMDEKRVDQVLVRPKVE